MTDQNESHDSRKQDTEFEERVRSRRAEGSRVQSQDDLKMKHGNFYNWQPGDILLYGRKRVQCVEVGKRMIVVKVGDDAYERIPKNQLSFIERPNY